MNVQLATSTETGSIQFARLPGEYATKAQAMKAAKKAAGRGARYTGDNLSIRYSGPNGTAYVCE